MSTSQILKNAFARKKRKNPGYSLRALARDLGISPSFLSRIMNGKRLLSRPLLDSAIKVLQLDQVASRALREAVFHDAKLSLPKMTERPNPKIEKYAELSSKEFSLLEVWHALPLLDLVTCSDFESDTKWMAQRLGISEVHVKSTLHLLTEMGLIENTNGKLKRTENHIRFPTTQSHALIRHHHELKIQKALTYLKTQKDKDFELRHFSGVSFAADPLKIPKARERLYQALYEVAELLDEGSCTEVYQLNLQLFPLTKKR